jgi:carboxylesterase type B
MTRQLSQNSVRVSIPGKGVLQGAEVLDPVSGRVKCHRFSRVPYVCPPTGPRRWRKPEPLPPSFSYGSESHPGKYTKPCAPCPQPPQGGIHSYSEDCLQLNIWVPLGDPPTGGWPVLFYIRQYTSPLEEFY